MNEQLRGGFSEVASEGNKKDNSENLPTPEEESLKEVITSQSEEEIKKVCEDKEKEFEDTFEKAIKGVERLRRLKREILYTNLIDIPSNPNIIAANFKLNGMASILDKNTLAPLSGEYEKILTTPDGKLYGERKKLGGLIKKIEEIKLEMQGYISSNYSEEVIEMLKQSESK